MYLPGAGASERPFAIPFPLTPGSDGGCPGGDDADCNWLMQRASGKPRSLLSFLLSPRGGMELVRDQRPRPGLLVVLRCDVASPLLDRRPNIFLNMGKRKMILFFKNKIKE